jgi:hypothetical protein
MILEKSYDLKTTVHVPMCQMLVDFQISKDIFETEHTVFGTLVRVQ